MRNYVIINGVNSLSIKGLAISKLPSISKPPLRVMTEEIDGRDGDIITELGYGSYDKELVIGLYENYDINEIIGFFNQEGTIVFSNEDDKYYNFKIINQIDYEALIKFRTANVTLHCQPFKYPLEEEPIELIDTYIEEEGEEITLTPTEDAPMEITLKGNTSQVIIPGEAGLEVEGTSISVNDVNTTKEDYITPQGNTSQVQYSGKNLFDTSLLPVTQNGITISKNANGDIVLNGTPDFNEGYKTIVIGTTVNVETGTYSSSVANKISGVGVLNGNGGLNFTMDDTLKTKSTTISTPYTMQPAINIRYNVGTLTNFVLNPQLEKANASTSYEPYCGGTPSPNPDYPQDIHSVSGDNEIEVCGKNLAFTNWASDFVSRINDNTKAKLETYDGKNCLAFYPSVGNGDYDNKYMFKPLGGFKANTQYTFKIDKYSTSGFGDMDIAYTDGSVDEIKDLTSNSWNSIVKTSTANKTVKYLKPRWRNNTWQYIDLDTFMVYEGIDTTQPYEPYIGNIYPLYLGIENLLSNKLVQGYISNTLIDDRTTTTRTDAILLKKGTYTFNFSYSSEIWVKMVKYANATDTSGTFEFNSKKSSYVYTFTLDNDTYVRFGLDETLSNLSTATIELTKGSTPQHISTQPITLNKIGTYQDKLIKSNDKWYWYREIGKTILSSNFVWVKSGTYQGSFYANALPYNIAINFSQLYCSHFMRANIDNSSQVSSNYARGTCFIENATYGQIDCWYDDGTATLDQWKTWLSTNQPVIYYPLSTPTTTEITDTNLINQLDDLYNATIYETTNISSVPNDLEPFIDIKYNVVTPSPSPQRPSAINVVSGTNTITIANEDDTESQTFNIRLGSLKLYKLNDTQDYIYKSADKWYIRNHAKEKTFTGAGSEGWGCFQNGRGEWCILTTNIRNEVKQGSSLIADILPFFSNVIFNGLYNQNAITLGGKNIELMIEGINDNDDELFTDFLAIHNLTILYELATPIDTEITDTDLIEDLEALLEATSYNPETNITQTSNDKPFIIYAKALEGGSGEAEVINEGNIYAKPIFEIEGNGIVQVLIDNNEVLQVDTTNDTIIIDTENMEAINKSDNTLANRQVIGDYSKIKLVSGESNVKLTGNYTKGTITKYTRYL